MRITGRVEDGSGTNPRLAKAAPPGDLDSLGYRPYPGTLNVRVHPQDRLDVMRKAGHTINGITFWEANLNGQRCHVRVSSDPRTLEREAAS